MLPETKYADWLEFCQAVSTPPSRRSPPGTLCQITTLYVQNHNHDLVAVDYERIATLQRV